MTTETILRLNQLNRDFYEQSGESFSRTRQQPWAGWSSLEKWLEPLLEPVNVLDVGCGNGRFFDFLQTILPDKKLAYLGVDSSQTLTSIAIEADHHLQENKSLAWMQRDVVRELLDLRNSYAYDQPFSLIALFGVLHHLPSYRLREMLFSQLADSLTDTGLLVFTTWQFKDHPQLKSKIVDPSLVGIDPKELEENDFILDWQRDQVGHRYCHYFEPEEVERLLQAGNLIVVDDYLADGPANQANHYYVCQKSDLAFH